jgi:hypothetical protein
VHAKARSTESRTVLFIARVIIDTRMAWKVRVAWPDGVVLM